MNDRFQPSEQPPTPQQRFGARLKLERERAGVSLEALVRLSNVSASYFEGLERGDVSRWPPGIFRRSFVRTYAQTVGLDVEATVADFLQLFPDEGAAERRRDRGARLALADAALAERRPLRLTLDEAAGPRSWSEVVGMAWRRVLAAGLDLAVVSGLAAVVWIARLSASLWIPLSSVAVGYHAIGLLALGMTPGWWAVSRLFGSEPRFSGAGIRGVRLVWSWGRPTGLPRIDGGPSGSAAQGRGADAGGEFAHPPEAIHTPDAHKAV